MKILFFGWRYTYFRNFDSVLRELAARGHQVHLAVEEEERKPLVEALAAEYPSITFGPAPVRANDDWSWLATRLRHGLEHLRYQHRMFDDTPKIRDRSRERTPGAFVRAGDAIRRYGRWARGPASSLTRWLERAVPDDPGIAAFIAAQAPDVVLVTPLITLGSSQIDCIRAARTLGVPTALCVWSWDHLSSKALVREAPDRVFVWNETQKREAVELHGVEPGHVVVTGAQCFDKWFDRAPSRDRAGFCAEVGLPADRPFVLYVCSAPFVGSQPEAPFVVEWIRRVRVHDSARLRSAPILVRPHPSRRKEWEGIDLTPFGNVVLWGDNPIDARARADYFDSLFHSAAVVGLNTSAFIEAGIVGRPVYTILLPEWHENQLGTVHFRYLFDAGGGLLISSRSFDEHLAQLEDGLANPSSEVRPFVRAFVRPHGLDVAATPRFVEAVEGMRGMTVPPRVPARLPGLAQRVLRRAAAWRHDVRRELWVYSERELDTIVRMRTFREAKAAEERERKRQRAAEKTAKVAEREAGKERHRAGKRARKHGGSEPPPRMAS